MVRGESLARRIRQPASAAIAGIVFAIILTVVIVMLRSAVPVIGPDAGSWADDPGRRGSVDLALGLIPFAGIAFLWFIGVIRAQVGASEDRFVGTVFLGSGILFVAMLFAAAASLMAVLSLQQAGVDMPVEALIIPLDTAYQNNGMLRAHGLAYRLLQNNIPLRWIALWTTIITFIVSAGFSAAKLNASATRSRSRCPVAP